MRSRLLLIWGMILLLTGNCFAQGVRALKDTEEWLARLDQELKETRSELASLLKKRSQRPNPKMAADVEKTRVEFEATVATLLESKHDAEQRRQAIRATFDPRKPCVICSGKMTRVENVAAKHHHKNRDVWPAPPRSGEGCGNGDYFAVVCTRCWAAPSLESGIWMQSAEDLTAFVFALSAGITSVPLPPANERKLRWRFEWFQQSGGKRHEAASLWWNDAPPEFAAALNEHAKKHGLEFRDESIGLIRTFRIATPSEQPAPAIPGQ